MINKNDNIQKNRNIARIVDFGDDLKQITINDQRYYKKSDKYYPSVTFVLSYYPKGKWFEDWLKENGQNSDSIASEAAEKGSNVHQAIEGMLKGKKPQWIADNGYANYSLEEWLMILKFADFWNTYKPILVESEYHVFSYEHKFAGTIDLIIKLNGELWLLDIKTSNSLHTTYELQVEAYRNAWNENNINKIIKTGILWLNAKTRKPSSDPTKIQGKGWSLVTSDRSNEENMSIFLKVYDIFKIENTDSVPATSKYPNTVELIFE